jgi:peptidyl-tRNA hydrolase, PTH1 family
MKLIVGLGNPGKEYEHTRHNAGFRVVDALAVKLQATSYKPQAKFNAEIVKIGETLLVKPQTYMNNSGEAVQRVMQFYRVLPEDLWVIHDDLDIRLGDYKIKKGIGPKIHNGVNSLRTVLGYSDFWYVRIGVDNRVEKIPGEAYVLARFKAEELDIINRLAEQVADELISRHL